MKRTTILEIAELALICALMVGGKEAMRSIPNVHPVTVILIFTVIRYGWKAFYPIVGFVLFEIMLYGLGMWSLTYLIVWPIITFVFCLFQKNESTYFWAIMAGVSGLCFGALCEIPFIFVIGFPASVTTWIGGIPYDIIHCVGNFFLTLFLLPPLMKLNKKIARS